MTQRVTSRRADVGLPDVANDFAYDDPTPPGYGTYFDDGFTWVDAAGSVLAGQQPLEVRPRFRGYALRHAFGEGRR